MRIPPAALRDCFANGSPDGPGRLYFGGVPGRRAINGRPLRYVGSAGSCRWPSALPVFKLALASSRTRRRTASASSDLACIVKRQEDCSALTFQEIETG